MPSFAYAFIGAGRMATALAAGIVDAGLAGGADIVASDPDAQVRAGFAERLAGATLLDDNAQAARDAELVILAVKPQVMPDVLASLAGAIGPETVVVSIAAGVPLRQLEVALPPGTRTVRVMPNTPCLIGRGASGYSPGRHATPQDLQRVDRLLAAVGIAFQLPEALLDAVTGLSGSGPGFVYTMIEALSDGGVLTGLPRHVAHRLAAQTVAGAAEMVMQTGRHPAELREQVTSPGGTTIAGLEALEQHGLRSAVIAAVKAAAERSCELGRGSSGGHSSPNCSS